MPASVKWVALISAWVAWVSWSALELRADSIFQRMLDKFATRPPLVPKLDTNGVYLILTSHAAALVYTNALSEALKLHPTAIQAVFDPKTSPIPSRPCGTGSRAMRWSLFCRTNWT